MKFWMYSCGVLANNPQKQQHFLFSCCSRRLISCTKFCGFMLFALGLISLFTGHVASNLEWYSHPLLKPSWFYNQVILNVPINRNGQLASFSLYLYFSQNVFVSTNLECTQNFDFCFNSFLLLGWIEYKGRVQNLML